MIDKDKLTPEIWFDEELWNVIKTFSPTKDDDYVLVQRTIEGRVHLHTNTTPINMRLLDFHNDEFYPDTAEVKLIMEQKKLQRKQREKWDERHEEILSDMWLSLTK